MSAPLYSVRDDGSIELAVHAQPGAGRSQVTGRHGDALKIRVAAPPEHGRANDALIGLLATAFGVTAKDVTLVSGERSRAKRFRLAGIDPAEFEDRLDGLVATGSAGPGPLRPQRPESERRL